MFVSLSTFVTIASLLAEQPIANAHELHAGGEICVEGFVMDFFCIDRGTLFDNPSVVSLAEPERHSVHCLVDVAPCLASDFEVLYALPEEQVTSDIKHARGWRLDGPSKQKIIALAREVGTKAAKPACDTCTEGGTLARGFHAGMNANIVTPSDGTNPAVISVSSVEQSTPDSPFCQEPAVPASLITAAGGVDFGKVARIHGALMLIGWGFLLPSGVLVAKFFRLLPNGLWFKIHRAVQSLGLVCAIAGFIIALINFDVFSSGGGISFIHGCMGFTTMMLGMFQPLNAVIRPHPNQEGQEPNKLRTIWEIVHKSSGYGACLLAVCTIGIGTTLLPDVGDQRSYQMAYGIGAACILCLFAAFRIHAKSKYNNVESGDHMSPLMADP